MQGMASTPSSEFNRTEGGKYCSLRSQHHDLLRNQSLAEVFREETSPSHTESNVETKVLPNYP